MNCIEEFLTIIDSSVNQGHFPTWDFDEGYVYVGSMRVSGFQSSRGVALVFEHVEYSVKEFVIQGVANCLATFPVEPYLIVGDAIHLNYYQMVDPQTDELFFGAVKATSRGQTFAVRLDKTELIQGGYLERGVEAPTLPAVLFKLCDTVPSEWLYSKPEFLVQGFAMGSDATRLFYVEEWQHLSLEDVYEEEIKPSSSPDIVALVEAACNGNTSPQLKGTPNTSWRKQWRGGG